MSEALAFIPYYRDEINLKDVNAVEASLQALLQEPVTSVAELESWLNKEEALMNEIQEAMSGHEVDFCRDINNGDKRDRHLHDQSAIQPLLLKYSAAFDQKFCASPVVDQLSDARYELMRKYRRAKVELFREENIPLTVREQELVTKYTEMMGGLSIEWDGETRSYPFVMAQVDSPDRSVRERAWRALAGARRNIKGDVDDIMNELVQIRHQMAVNAGFENYRDYAFKLKNREYSIKDCYDLHLSVEQHVVPAWGRLAKVFQSELGVATYRPWDASNCMMQGVPYSTVTELMDGVDEMFGRTDPDFQARFRFMRDNGLLDLEARQGKAPGGFCVPLMTSRNNFIFANFSPSFFALTALIHEMGHAVNCYLQFNRESGIQEHNFRMEVAELYSHGMELLLMDKLDVFYPDEHQFKNAEREELHRAFNMLIGPLSGDLFQHWLYTHPHHTPAERDAMYLEISKRFLYNPIDITGLEEDIGSNWIATTHFLQTPFYNIEYSISELGALQLLALYRDNPERATALFKQGAATDFNQSIARIYEDSGVHFDFSAEAIEKTAKFVEGVIAELQ